MTPALLIHRHIDTLLGHLPGTLDGDAESIHQARIATRRLREVLPYVAATTPAAFEHSGIVERVRSAGRHLGRVRELDVMSVLLEQASQRIPAAAAVAALARRKVDERRQVERRAMVKALEKLELDRLRELSAWSTHGSRWRGAAHVLRRPEWVDEMWTRIADRSEAAADAVRRAPGVYFPNRAHKARIAVKKLRYCVEVANEAGRWQADRVLEDLRRVQGTLGDLHDAQVIVDSLDELLGEQAASQEAGILRAMCQDDVARDYAKYVRRRDRVFAIADACARAAGRARAAWRPRRTLAAASLVAAPLLLGVRAARGH